MTDDLSHLSSSAIDSLPFGYIALSPDGTIRKYNRYEADLARKDPKEVLGKNFFREVAPCTQVREFEGRFRSFVDQEDGEATSTLSFDFEFTFRHGSQRVRIGFVRSPLDREVIVTVNRVRDLALPLSPQLEHRAITGQWIDAAGQAVALVGTDFWLALDRTHQGVAGTDRRHLSHQLGKAWGSSYIQRIEGFVQESHAKTLREVELQVALQALSGASGLLGLGRFEVELGYRDRGMIVVAHSHSPLAGTVTDHDERRCHLLAGLHAGFLEHLAGRELEGREIRCSHRSDEPCIFAIGTGSRLRRLLDAEPGSTDADLLATLGSLGAREPGAEDSVEDNAAANAAANTGGSHG